MMVITIIIMYHLVNSQSVSNIITTERINNSSFVIIVDNLDFHGMIFDIDHIKNRNTKQLVKKIKRFKDYKLKYHRIYYGILWCTRRDSNPRSSGS